MAETSDDISSDSDDSILEVPVPPKPVPPLIDINDSEESSSSDDEEASRTRRPNNTRKSSPRVDNDDSDVAAMIVDDHSNSNLVESDNIVLNCTEIQPEQTFSGIRELRAHANATSGLLVDQDAQSADKINHSSGNTARRHVSNPEVSIEYPPVPRYDQVTANSPQKSPSTQKRPRKSLEPEPQTADEEQSRKRWKPSAPASAEVPFNEYLFQPVARSIEAFYNEPCHEDSTKDVREIQKEMSNDPRNWSILSIDRQSSRPRSRGKICASCQREGHTRDRCPDKRKAPPCHMCGKVGHVEARCPESVCLTCGTKYNTYRKTCECCRTLKCGTCKAIGHKSNDCPDLWRRYHQTNEATERNEEVVSDDRNKIQIPVDIPSIIKTTDVTINNNTNTDPQVVVRNIDLDLHEHLESIIEIEPGLGEVKAERESDNNQTESPSVTISVQNTENNILQNQIAPQIPVNPREGVVIKQERLEIANNQIETPSVITPALLKTENGIFESQTAPRIPINPPGATVPQKPTEISNNQTEIPPVTVPVQPKTENEVPTSQITPEIPLNSTGVTVKRENNQISTESQPVPVAVQVKTANKALTIPQIPTASTGKRVKEETIENLDPLLDDLLSEISLVTSNEFIAQIPASIDEPAVKTEAPTGQEINLTPQVQTRVIQTSSAPVQPAIEIKKENQTTLTKDQPTPSVIETTSDKKKLPKLKNRCIKSLKLFNGKILFHFISENCSPPFTHSIRKVVAEIPGADFAGVEAEKIFPNFVTEFDGYFMLELIIGYHNRALEILLHTNCHDVLMHVDKLLLMWLTRNDDEKNYIVGASTVPVNRVALVNHLRERSDLAYTMWSLADQEKMEQHLNDIFRLTNVIKETLRNATKETIAEIEEPLKQVREELKKIKWKVVLCLYHGLWVKNSKDTLHRFKIELERLNKYHESIILTPTWPYFKILCFYNEVFVAHTSGHIIEAAKHCIQHHAKKEIEEKSEEMPKTPVITPPKIIDSKKLCQQDIKKEEKTIRDIHQKIRFHHNHCYHLRMDAKLCRTKFFTVQNILSQLTDNQEFIQKLEKFRKYVDNRELFSKSEFQNTLKDIQCQLLERVRLLSNPPKTTDAGDKKPVIKHSNYGKESTSKAVTNRPPREVPDIKPKIEVHPPKIQENTPIITPANQIIPSIVKKEEKTDPTPDEIDLDLEQLLNDPIFTDTF